MSNDSLCDSTTYFYVNRVGQFFSVNKRLFNNLYLHGIKHKITFLSLKTSIFSMQEINFVL